MPMVLLAMMGEARCGLAWAPINAVAYYRISTYEAHWSTARTGLERKLKNADRVFRPSNGEHRRRLADQ